MIKRVGPSKYAVYSADGKKRLSKPMSKKSAVKRKRQIEHEQQTNDRTGG